MGGRVAVPVAAALWAGLLFARSGAADARLAALLLALSLAAGGIAAFRARGATALLVAAFALAGASRGFAHRARIEVARAALGASDTYWVDGVIVEPPQLESGAPLVTLEVHAGRPALVAGSRVRLRLPEGSVAEWGDSVRALARLDPPPRLRNPGGFDLRAAADASGIAGSGFAPFADVRAARGLAAWPRVTVMRWRRAIERVLHRSLSERAAELVVPLVFGDRSAIDTDLDAAFRAAGLTHLLALSGLHVAWLAAVARAIAATLGAGVRGRALARGGCAALYLLLAGPIPSLARAAFGELLLALARFTQRALDPVQALAVAAVTLLALRPGWAGDLGFQLSAAATTGLVTIGAAIGAARGPARPLALAFGPTASAQLVSLPILLARFHALAWTAGATNLIAVPVTGLLLIAAWIGALFDLAVPGAGAPFLHACEPLAWMLRAIVESAQRVPHALLSGGPGAAAAWLAALGAALLALGFTPARTIESRALAAPPACEAARIAGAALALAALVLLAGASPLRPPPARTWITVLDVGQGDAIAIGNGGRWWLVDCGPRTPRADEGQAVVLPFLRWAGVRSLEFLVLTHDDGDHTGGARAVLRGMHVARLLAPAARRGVPGPLARFRGTPIRTGEELAGAPEMIVRWPPPADSLTSYWEQPVTSADNGAVAVLEIGRGAGRALLAADADSAVERALAIAPPLALLKVAHHGSGSSSGAGFLASVRPRLAAISVGRRNRFGHPDPGALARLAASGVTLHRTDEEGALWFELSDSGAQLLDWRNDAWRAPDGPPAARRIPAPQE